MALETSTLRRRFRWLPGVILATAVVCGTNFGAFFETHSCALLLRRLDAEAPRVSSEIKQELRSRQHEAWPELRDRLVARDGAVRRAFRGLRAFLPARFAPRDTLEAKRAAVVAVLEVLGPATPDRLQDFAAGLRATRESETREALGRLLGSQGAKALDTLSVLVLDDDPNVQATALRALHAVVRGWADEALPRADLAILVASRLNSSRTEVVLAAGTALAPLANAAAGAIPRLLERLADPAAEVRGMSAELLGRIARDAGPSVAGLTGALADADPKVRATAATALGRFGSEASSAVAPLARLLDTGPVSVGVAAAHALGRIGPSAASAVPALVVCLDRAESPAILRSGAATALKRIARDPGVSVPALERASRDTDAYLRENAVRALAGFGPDAVRALPGLIDALSDARESIRVLATEALGRVGAGAASAIPALHAARDNNPSVMNRPVLEALARIEGRATSFSAAEVSPSVAIPDTPSR